jgi:hypothetical protein
MQETLDENRWRRMEQTRTPEQIEKFDQHRPAAVFIQCSGNAQTGIITVSRHC